MLVIAVPPIFAVLIHRILGRLTLPERTVTDACNAIGNSDRPHSHTFGECPAPDAYNTLGDRNIP